MTTAESVAPEERRLVAALRAGDEQAFQSLLGRHHASLLRLALTYVRDRQVAEEVVQETWLAVLRGIGAFRGDASLKTWIFRILANIARTRAVRERRSVPFSTLSTVHGEAAVDPERFLPDHDRWAGHWASAPSSWSQLPEDRLASKEVIACIRETIEKLPDAQRQVITLRDVEGFASEEVCGLLELSEGNQRVLLHRARSKVRAALERQLEAGGGP
jgi:RNA polymerase sigma-70 factor (ECF subfamily)